MPRVDRAPRQRLDADARRDAILAAARDLYAAHPYSEVSTKQVAESAGSSAPLVFHYFGSKAGLYTAVVSDAVAGLADSAARRRCGPPTPYPVARTRTYLAAHLSRPHRQPPRHLGVAADRWGRAGGGAGGTTPGPGRIRTDPVRPPGRRLLEPGTTTRCGATSGSSTRRASHGWTGLPYGRPRPPHRRLARGARRCLGRLGILTDCAVEFVGRRPDRVQSWRLTRPRGCSSMVELQSSKLITRVRFPSSAPLPRSGPSTAPRYHPPFATPLWRQVRPSGRRTRESP